MRETNEAYAKRVTIQAPAGPLGTLATLDGWQSEGRGVFTVTDPEWRDDVRLAGDAKVLLVEDVDA